MAASDTLWAVSDTNLWATSDTLWAANLWAAYKF
jgi:hypothetical protein